MWKCREKVGSGKGAVGSEERRPSFRRALTLRCGFGLLLTAHCLLLTASCRRDMQDQPRMKPFRSSPFFRDGLSTRAPIDGTVARGFLKTDTEFYTGKKAGRAGATAAPAQPAQSALAPGGPQPATAGAAAPLQGAAAYPDDVELFPIPVTSRVVERGKERYEIFCSACHGLTGNGDGMIVRRGFRRAASFNDDRLRQAPVGHFFDAISNGWGAMPSYAPQIPTEDRWAIIAYIRALQLSQQNQKTEPATAPAAATPHSGASQLGGHQ